MARQEGPHGARDPGPSSPPPSRKGPSQNPGGHCGFWEMAATAARTRGAVLGCLEMFLKISMACNSVCAGAPGKTPFQYDAAESSISSQDG